MSASGPLSVVSPRSKLTSRMRSVLSACRFTAKPRARINYPNLTLNCQLWSGNQPHLSVR